MARIALGIEYAGHAYCGWQKQQDCIGVQQRLEQALAQIACEAVEVVCAGRTDRGVHALSQVVHFDTTAIRPQAAWVQGVNSHLPNDIRVLWSREVDDNFHARFSAVARRYRYVLLARSTASALFSPLQAWTGYTLDADVMHQAAQSLVGEHDFSSFRAAECQAKHPRRCITHIQITRRGDYFFFDVEANAFLHHMVRNIVGSLMMVGKGERSIDWIAEVLAARDRRLAAATAPASGLYLTHVRYPSHYQFPQVSMQSLWACPTDMHHSYEVP